MEQDYVFFWKIILLCLKLKRDASSSTSARAFVVGKNFVVIKVLILLSFTQMYFILLNLWGNHPNNFFFVKLIHFRWGKW